MPDAAIEFSKIMAQGFSEAEQRELLTKLQRIIFNVSYVTPHTGDRFGLLPPSFSHIQPIGQEAQVTIDNKEGSNE